MIQWMVAKSKSPVENGGKHLIFFWFQPSTVAKEGNKKQKGKKGNNKHQAHPIFEKNMTRQATDCLFLRGR